MYRMLEVKYSTVFSKGNWYTYLHFSHFSDVGTKRESCVSRVSETQRQLNALDHKRGALRGAQGSGGFPHLNSELVRTSFYVGIVQIKMAVANDKIFFLRDLHKLAHPLTHSHDEG